MSLRRSLYVAPKPPEGDSKTRNNRFPCKIALRLKKVCYKVSLCENCEQQSCEEFIGLTIRAKMIGGTFRSTGNFWIKLIALSGIADFRSIFARNASAVTPVWKLSGTKLQGIHWPNYPCKNDWWWVTPSTWNFESKWPRWSEIADFRSIFVRSASAVSPSEKCSINTSRKYTIRAFQWAQDEHRTLSLSPQRGL